MVEGVAVSHQMRQLQSHSAMGKTLDLTAAAAQSK